MILVFRIRIETKKWRIKKGGGELGKDRNNRMLAQTVEEL